ncbi:MAG: iron-containing alcohol dehydrogenase [Thermoleophilia bacterium]
MLVRWGLRELGGALAAVGVVRPLLVTTRRWAGLELPVERRFAGVGPHADAAAVREAIAATRAAGADGLVAVGGGSAIDSAKAVSADADLPVVAVPTTYAGAEWTTGFGSRDATASVKRHGSGARVEAIVYEPSLTLGLPPGETGGTALNALAHCAEALYSPGRSPVTDAEALLGARLIAASLPRVLDDGADVDARADLLRGAMHAGASLRAGVCVAHALAQALGGATGVSHGRLNAICLPIGLRFNAEVAADELARLAEAMGTTDPVGWIEDAAARSGPTRLRDHGVPAGDLPRIAEAAAERAPARANPRPVSAADALALLRAAW